MAFRSSNNFLGMLDRYTIEYLTSNINITLKKKQAKICHLTCFMLFSLNQIFSMHTRANRKIAYDVNCVIKFWQKASII